MPAWVATALVYIVKWAAQAVLPIVLKDLKNSGAINSVEAEGIKVGTHVLVATKVEDTYPADKVTGVTTGDLDAS